MMLCSGRGDKQTAVSTSSVAIGEGRGYITGNIRGYYMFVCVHVVQTYL